MRQDIWLAQLEQHGSEAYKSFLIPDPATGVLKVAESNQEVEQRMEQIWRIHTRNRAEYKLKFGKNPAKDYGYWNPSSKDLLKDELYAKVKGIKDMEVVRQVWNDSLEDEIHNIQRLEGISDKKKKQMISWAVMRHENALRDYESIWENLRSWERLVRECILCRAVPNRHDIE